MKNLTKKQKALVIVAGVLAAILIFFLVVNLIPPAKNVEEHPFVVGKGALPMVAAHRGGGVSNPENTMLAFREAVKTFKVDIIESDLYLTKDGYLVYNHDSYVDETCNVNGDISFDEVKELCKDKANRHYIEDMTLAELQALNFGFGQLLLFKHLLSLRKLLVEFLITNLLYDLHIIRLVYLDHFTTVGTLNFLHNFTYFLF